MKTQIEEWRQHVLAPPKTSEDWSAYHEIRRKVLFENRGLFGVYDDHHPDESAEGHHPFLLLSAGEPVGTIRIDIKDRVAIFRRVAIRENVQRRGHGSVMLTLAEQFVRQKGCELVRSFVNPAAVAFYERCGFKLDATHTRDASHVPMQKGLAQTIVIRPVEPGDRDSWARMRHALWPGNHTADIERFIRGQAREPLAVLIAFNQDGEARGFIELSIRPHAEGCLTDRVAYIEGWYVEPDARRQGIGAGLVRAAEAWAREKGCTELGSDAELENLDSADAHRAVGFEEAGIVRCFRKSL